MTPRRPATPRPAISRAGALLAAAALTVAALLLAGCGGRPTTHHRPGTSHQEATGDSGTLLPARDESGHRLRELPAADAPTVRAEARPDSEGGWNVHLTVERFRFTPESTGGAALPGRGHARLLVDGRETTRLYGPWGYVPPGAHTLTVRLHADDHTVWAVAGTPVQATVRLGTTPSTSAPTASAPAAPTSSAPASVPAASSTPASSAPPSPPPTGPGRTVTLTITGTTVQPPPSRIELKKGELLTLRVTGDRADTLHVHGYDRELPLSPGTTATLTLTVDRTGLFEVETHESGLVLTQLVVR
ncbi:lipase chaperone [Streptomyces globisporus]|uniref:lipase chaperone n=1 Tax=Streptomyces globisporus TaxID=1908 RepID=UPI00068985A6|nr:lipase chaperone [Streptomyces globisporus]